MDSSRTLAIVLTAKDQASKTLQEVGANAQKTASSIKEKLSENVVQLGAAFAATTGVIYSSISAYEESERSTAQLEAVLKSTKEAAGLTRDEILRYSTTLQQQTSISDEAITQAQSMLLTFTNIGKDVFPDTTKAVLDMSTAMNGGAIPNAEELRNQAIQLGKALQDPDAGLGALHRVGVNVDELKKKFTDSMSIQEKQKLILQELATEFGGSAYKAAHTFGGQMELLKQNVNDLQETIGKGLVDALIQSTGGFDNVNNSIRTLNNFLTQHKDILLGVVVALGAVAVTFGVLFVAALVAVAGTAGLVILAIGGIVAVVGFVAGIIIANWTAISAFFQNIWNTIVTTFNTTKDNLVLAIMSIITWFQNLPMMVSDILYKFFFQDIPFWVGYVVGYLSVAIPQMITDVINWFTKLPSNILNLLEQTRSFIVTKFTEAWNWVTANVSTWPKKIHDFIQSIPQLVADIFENTKRNALNKMQELWDGVTGWWNKIKGIFDAIGSTLDGIIDKARQGFAAGKQAGMSFADGGWVPYTGMALVHAGEYVLSKDMLAGRQAIMAPVTNNNTPININAVLNDAGDIDTLSQKLAFYLKTSGAL